jgi:lipopolysaccharide heptosyltransferase II
MEFVSRRPFNVDGGKVLVRSQNWIGDVVIATASLRCIRQSFPESTISVVAKPWVIPVLAHSPHVDEIIEYDGAGIHRGWAGILRLSRYLRSRQFQAAILLQRAFEAALIAFLARIPVRMGYTTDARGLLLTHRAKAAKAEFDIPRLEHDLRLLQGFGLKVDKKEILLPIGREQKGRAEDRLRDLGIRTGEPIVGFSPGAVGSPLKRWYPERFAGLAVKIRETYQAKVLLFGASREKELGDEICRRASVPEVVNLAGHTSLEDAIALIGLCGLFVTNDSGLMHVAAALDVPLVAIFGPTDPARTAPWSKRHVLVRDEGVDCYGCKMRDCRHEHKCMNVITVERVFQAVGSAVARYGIDSGASRMERLKVTGRTVPIVKANG